MRVKIALALALCALALAIGNAMVRYQSYRHSELTCSAMVEGKWASAIELSHEFKGRPLQEERVANCRCLALLETGSGNQCVAEVEQFWTRDEHSDWLPDPAISRFVISQLWENGKRQEAASRVRQAGLEYPEAPGIAMLEFEIRTQLESEETVLREISRRVTSKSPSGLLLLLADAHINRREYDQALELARLVDESDDLSKLAVQIQTKALGYSNQVTELRKLYNIGLNSSEARAEDLASYSIAMTQMALEDPQHSPVTLLEEALERHEEFSDRELLKDAFHTMLQLLSPVEPGRLAAVQEKAKQVLGEVHEISDEEIGRMSILAEEGETPVGTLVVYPRNPLPGDSLWVSAAEEHLADSTYEQYPIRTGEPVALRRTLGSHPVSWVWKNQSGDTCGSDSIWPLAGRETSHGIERGPCTVAQEYSVETRSGDSKTRVITVILDSADWRILRLLQVRGELPFLSYTEERGTSGTIKSKPAFTAAALRNILFPQSRGESTMVGFAFHLGGEIEAMNFIGKNPLSFLDLFRPEQEDLVTHLARRGRS